MRLGGRVGRIVSTVVVPLLAGATLAAVCLLTFSALSSDKRGGHDLSILGSQPVGVTRAARLPPQIGASDNGRYEHLVASAVAHEVGAEQAVAHARRLRNEAATAKSKAAALQSSLAQLLDEEASRDKAAERLAAKAQALDNQATHDVVARRSLSSSWNEALAAAKAKRYAFFVDEKRADEDKVKAKTLLNQERKLFKKSFAMVDQEAKAQAKVDRKNSELADERRKQRHITDREHVVVEEPQQYQHTIREAQQQARQQEEAQQQHQAQKVPEKSPEHVSAEQNADDKAEARLKRPLWGNRNWPSYYDNALTDPGSQKLFKADEPSHPAPRQLEMGDDNQAFDHPRPGADTAVIPRNHNPARMQAMYQVGSAGETAYSTNVRMGLPPPPHHMLVDKHPAIAPAILRKFEGDVQQMEKPVKNLEGRLEQALARMHARRAHKQALHLYHTDTEEWRDLSRKAEHEREERVAHAATESRELISTMNSAMEHANHEMKSEMRDTTNAMKGELEDVVHKFAAEGRGKVSKADSEAIAQTQAREAEMEKVMGEYVSHEREENHKLQNEMSDLVAQSERGKADVIAEAERWKHDEEAKYKHEMQQQVHKAEMKVDQARSEAAMALKEAQQDATVGGTARLRAAQAHEQHALQTLAKAETEERQQAVVFRREANQQHSQVTVLKSELERVEAEHEVHQEVLEARKRERERMEGRFEQQQRQQERKDAELREQLQDARAVAQREQEAALSKAKELAIARVKQQALRAMGKQRARLQAAEDLAHERKMEDEKERRIAAKEATELRLQQQQQRMVQQQQAPTNEASAAAERRGSRGRVAIAAGAQTEGGSGNRALKEAVTTNVAQELKAYERKIAAQEKMAVKKAVVEARKAASAKVDSMAEQLHRVENKLWRKEQSKQLAIENVFGSLGAYSPHAMTKIHTTPRASERTQPTAAPPQQVPQGASRRSSAPLTVAARAEERRGVAAAHAATQPHAAHESEAQQLAMAKALGFSSVHALEKHEQQVRGGVNLWGLPDGGEKRVAAARAMPNPAAVEKMREEEAAAAKPHAPQHQAFYNSGLSADVDVPVALAASNSNTFL